MAKLRKVDVDALADKFRTNAQFKLAFEQDPKAAVTGDKAVTPVPAHDDPEVYKHAINALGVAVTVALTGAVMLGAAGLDVPDVVTALGSAAVGALAGLLAPQKPNSNQED